MNFRPYLHLLATIVRGMALLGAFCVAYFCLLPVAQGRSAISLLGHHWAEHGFSYAMSVVSATALIASLLGLAWHMPRFSLFSLYIALPFSTAVGVVQLHHLGFL